MQRPLRRRPADAVIAEAVDERIAVVDPMHLRIGIGERATRVVVEVVVARAFVEHADVPEDVRHRGGDEVVLPDASRLGVAATGAIRDGAVVRAGARDVEGVVVDPRVREASALPRAEVDLGIAR